MDRQSKYFVLAMALLALATLLLSVKALAAVHVAGEVVAAPNPGFAVAPAPTVPPPSPARIDPECVDAADLARCDLEAQWVAARAARASERWSFWQMILSTAGLFGLLASLYLTRRAVSVAEGATHDTERALEISKTSANAANALAETAKSTAESQLRAYIGLQSASFTRRRIDIDNRWNVEFSFVLAIKNFGDTPARGVRIGSEMEVDQVIGAKNSAPLDKLVRVPNIQPSSVYQYNRTGIITADDDAEITVEKLALYLYFAFQYEDIFGRQYEEAFCFKSVGDQIDNGILTHTQYFRNDAQPD